MKITLAYFGTPLFSASLLEKLLTDKNLPIEVKLVVTQKDKPVGKKQIMTPSPVKEMAKKYKIPIMTTGDGSGRAPTKAQESILSNDYMGNQRMKNVLADFKTSSDLSEHLWEGNFRQDPLLKIDLALVCAFGQIIPQELLNVPKYGFWNIHYSLLPKYRGASPVAYALILGEKKTGVTIFQMDEKIDHGPIITQEELEILPDERRGELEKRLTDLAFEMFRKLISTGFNRLQPTAQADNLATYTRLLKKDDGFVPLTTLKKALNNQPLTYEELPEIIKEYLFKYQISKIKNQNDILKIKNKKFASSYIIFNLFRGLSPWPGIWTLIRVNPPNHPSESISTWQKRLKITDLKYQDGGLTILRVQLEGKKEVDFETFNRAYKIF